MKDHFSVLVDKKNPSDLRRSVVTHQDTAAPRLGIILVEWLLLLLWHDQNQWKPSGLERNKQQKRTDPRKFIKIAQVFLKVMILTFFKQYHRKIMFCNVGLIGTSVKWSTNVASVSWHLAGLCAKRISWSIYHHTYYHHYFPTFPTLSLSHMASVSLFLSLTHTFPLDFILNWIATFTPIFYG